MEPITTILFDAYGTLLEHSPRRLVRDLSRALCVDPRRVTTAMGSLLVASYAGDEEEAAAWCRSLGIQDPTARERATCAAVLEEHSGRANAVEGALPLLRFLKRRGYRLGLLSNAARAFKAPVERLGLSELFDAVVFSCDVGRAKPELSLYRGLCDRLNVLPEGCLFVGDSRVNDYEAPRALGMRAILLRDPAAMSHTPSSISQLAWADLAGSDSRPGSLLHVGMEVHAFGNTVTVREIENLPDAEQGRYNLVARIRVANEHGEEQELFCKRYLLPESAYVEETAYEVMRLLGLADVRAHILDGPEPLLLMTRAGGEAWEEVDLDEAAIEELGTQCAAAYLIGNADLRPRNTLVDKDGPSVRLNVIDFEHCFFDRALDVSGVDDPRRPEAIDVLARGSSDRTRRRALSSAATRRCRRSFLPVDNLDSEVVRPFRQGWKRVFERAKASAADISSLLISRVYSSPPLIIGTQAYRRAMARVDVDDILDRIARDPDEALAHAY